MRGHGISSVDKLKLKDGLILEEIVYAGTVPLQALRQGARFEALTQLPEPGEPLA